MALPGHRVAKDGRPDWENLEPGVRMTRQQRVAKATRGILTVPNVITVGGGWLGVTSALELARAPERSRKQNAWSAAKFVLSLLSDTADGAYAKKHDLRGPVGKVTDMGVDALRYTVGAPALAKGGFISKRFAAATLGLRAVKVAAAVFNRQPRQEQQASTVGTIGSAALGATLGVAVIDGVVRGPERDDNHWARKLQKGLGTAALVLDAIATAGYCVDTVRSWHQPADVLPPPPNPDVLGL